MLLCVEIANRTTSLGLFMEEDLVAQWRLQSVIERTADEYGLQVQALMAGADLAQAHLHGCVIASVNPSLTPTWIRVCEMILGQEPLIVGPGVKTGLRIKREAPTQLGTDRVANAVAAKALWRGPICIVDFGTATIFDAVDRSGDYVGHAIAPGLEMAARTLGQGTAQLPQVPLRAPEQAIGRNTVESIQSGLIFGFVGLVEGMIERFREQLGQDMGVIATGELAGLIASETTLITRVEPWLTLYGLAQIWQLNQPRR